MNLMGPGLRLLVAPCKRRHWEVVVGPIGTVLAHVVRRLTVDWMRLVILVLGIITVITCYTSIFVGFR